MRGEARACEMAPGAPASALRAVRAAVTVAFQFDLLRRVWFRSVSIKSAKNESFIRYEVQKVY